MIGAVAIVGDGGGVPELESALVGAGVTVLRCPDGEPRQVLRWVMNLERGTVGICVFADNDGRMTASLVTALDPDIACVTWARKPVDAARLLGVLSETPALVTATEDGGRVARIVCGLLGERVPGVGGFAAWPLAGTKGGVLEGAGPEKVESVPDADPMAESDSGAKTDFVVSDASDADLAVYQQLEAMMASPVKDGRRPEPVEIQKPGLDFSMPLRKLMSVGRAKAEGHRHKEVVGVHYLAALGEPFQLALAEMGVDEGAMAGLVAEQDAVGFDGKEAAVSDGVFDAVEFAKQRARDGGRGCVEVADFLLGLLAAKEASVARLLEVCGVSFGRVAGAIEGAAPEREACEGSFFVPSSLDQDSFYRFDAAQVKDVEKRLLDLPGFHKAAKRVPDKRKRGDAGINGSRPEMVTPIERVLAPVPDVPAVERVSSDFPDVDTIEYAADCLLEGQVIGFPSDIMFALVADGTNPAAIERLREAAEILPEKPLSILIHSTGQLKHLVRADLDMLEGLLDTLWPGALTLIFESAAGVGRPIAPGRKLAVRLPSDNLTLAVLSMLGRPLVVTSWDEVAPSGVSVTKLAEEKLAGRVALIVDAAGVKLREVVTTVVDLTTSPWTVVREGSVAAERVLEFDPAGGQQQ